MNTARAAWAAEYREARKLARFIETFHDKLSALPIGQRTFPQCRGFDFSRLSGDNLCWIGEGLFAPDARCHRSRLACLRRQSPRLPA
ncbi:hypothetical protein JY453_03515 [Stenotrophomonas maltophilia]|nr:hypothetical protein [Stenotrophomonas maltophilia]